MQRGLAFAAALVAIFGWQAKAQEPCDPDAFPMNQIRCHLDAAERAGSAARCLQTEDATVRFQCLTLYAERHEDPEVCGLIEGDDAQTAILRNTCVAGIAIAAVRPELCEQIDPPALVDSCLTQMVLERGADASLCERVENSFLKAACSEGRQQ